MSKQKFIPKILYKYRAFDRERYTEELLSKGEIYFATAAQLSDDFEYSFTWHKDEFVNLTEDECRVFKKPNNGSNNNLTKLTKNEYTEHLINGIKKKSPYGVLSLSESNNNPYMWERYAAGSTGICIGFDWEKFNLIFAGSDPPQKNIPRKISYAENPIIMSHPNQWLDVFTTKWQAYSFEAEWRMFYASGPHSSLDVRYAIKEIIFGNKITPENEELARSLVSDLKNIQFFHASRRFDQYKYKIVPFETA